jgi:hypothetical protein
MTGDAVREALRDLLLPTLVAAAFALFALPLLAESAVVVRDRALLDGALATSWLLAVASGLRLGTLLPGQGLGPLLRPTVGDTSFLLHRLGGFALVLFLQTASLLVGLLLHAPVRGSGPGLLAHGAACIGEAVVATLLAALFAVVVRPWLAAGCAGALLMVGHLEQELLAAVDASPLVRLLLCMVPSVERLDVQGELITGAALDPLQLALGSAELAGWSVVLGLALRVAWSRTDRG